MKDQINSVSKEATDAGLSQSERATMRNNMSLFMTEHPAQAPFAMRFADALDALYAGLERSPFVHMRGVASSAFAFFVVIGMGTSYAAGSALPGDALYNIKIFLNEPIQGIFATTDVAQAKWNTELVTRRLVEAEVLAVQGKLTPVARAGIQSSIAISTADFNVNVAKLAQADNSAEVANVQSDLEASLTGHEQVLTALAATENPKTIAPILASVTAHKDAATSGRVNAEARTSKKGGAAVKAAALSTQKEAHQAIKDVSTAIMTAIHDGATTTLSAQTSVNAAQITAASGDEKIEQGDYSNAFSSFQAAARAAQSAQVHIDAQVRLNSELRSDTETVIAISSDTAATSTGQ